MRSLSSPAIAAFATSGLNIVGVASGEPYQNILPGCRAVIVIASGGKSLWSSFTREIERHPDYFIGCTDPLDDFVERMQRRRGPRPRPAGGDRTVRELPRALCCRLSGRCRRSPHGLESDPVFELP